MFLPILLFNVLLVISSDGAPWQQKKAILVPKEDVQSSKCRDGREGIQIENAKRDLNGLKLILIALIINQVGNKCPNELLPIIEHCNADVSKDDMHFCVWKGLLVRIDADEDKCAENREGVDFFAKCGITYQKHQIGQMALF